MGFRENMAQVCQSMNLLADILPVVILIGYLVKEQMHRQTTNFNNLLNFELNFFLYLDFNNLLLKPARLLR